MQVALLKVHRAGKGKVNKTGTGINIQENKHEQTNQRKVKNIKKLHKVLKMDTNMGTNLKQT